MVINDVVESFCDLIEGTNTDLLQSQETLHKVTDPVSDVIDHGTLKLGDRIDPVCHSKVE